MEKSSKQLKERRLTAFAVMIGVLAGLFVATGYLFYMYLTHTSRIDMLLEERNHFLLESASTTRKLAVANDTIERLETKLIETQEDLEDLADDYRDEKDKNDEFEDQLRDLGRTVGDLNRLADLDEELLMKYSRVAFLSENYIPRNLEKIDDDWILKGRKDQYVIEEIMPFLEEMLEDAADDNIDLRIVSAYRTFDEQAEVNMSHQVVFGEGANQFSAAQGYSEHQLGTTIDLTTPEINGAYDSFGETEAFGWLLDNAHRYGFILSYPEGNQFYQFEPWHWRFVGVDLARDLHRDSANFYDWDQRKIDGYLLEIFD